MGALTVLAAAGVPVFVISRAAAEAILRALQQRLAKALFLRFSQPRRQAHADIERVEPERVDLHGLADPWRESLVALLGVHPGHLTPGLAAVQQSIGRIDADAEARTGLVGADDAHEHGIELTLQLRIGTRRQDREVAIAL